MYFCVYHGTPTNKNLEITNCLQENQIFRQYNSKNNQTLQQIDSYYKFLHYLQLLLQVNLMLLRSKPYDSILQLLQ